MREAFFAPILQVRKLRLQELEISMLAASFYPLHPEHAASLWPRTLSPPSIRGLERRRVCGEEGERLQ